MTKDSDFWNEQRALIVQGSDGAFSADRHSSWLDITKPAIKNPAKSGAKYPRICEKSRFLFCVGNLRYFQLQPV